MYTSIFRFVYISSYLSGVSYNQPKFCPMVSWKPDAETFANGSAVGQQTYSMFIGNNNTVYVAAQGLGVTRMWLEGGQLKTENVSNFSSASFNVFVTPNNDIYVYSFSKDGFVIDNQRTLSNNSVEMPHFTDRLRWCCSISFLSCYESDECISYTNQTSYNSSNSSMHGSVHIWSADTANLSVVMNVNGTCFSIFVDVNNTIYCSLLEYHMVVKKLVSDDVNNFTTVAGTGMNGSESNMLNYPLGIFVSTNFSLYVAEFANHRIQRFELDKPNGTTIVDRQASQTMDLSYPTGVILDGNGFLFIVDSFNQRVVSSGPNGFRCVVGCSKNDGSAANQLSHPTVLSFDRYGNIFVLDTANSRIQKFLLATNSCSKS